MIEFASLIEQADPAQRDRIVNDVREVDAHFLNLAMKKVVYFEEFIYLDDAILAEILGNVSPKVMAYAIYGADDSFRAELMRYLDYKNQRKVRDEEELISKKLSASFVRGAQRQILKIARQLEAKNKFVFEVTGSPRLRGKRSA